MNQLKPVSDVVPFSDEMTQIFVNQMLHICSDTAEHTDINIHIHIYTHIN